MHSCVGDGEPEDGPVTVPATPTTSAGPTAPEPGRLDLLVIFTSRLEECRRFYGGLGLDLAAERHGRGPEHFAAVLADGVVFELYPATPQRLTGFLRLGLTVVSDGGRRGAGSAPAVGRHLLTDPDGRVVDLRVVDVGVVDVGDV